MDFVTPKGLVGDWLERQFLDWQREQGGRRTVTEFSEWLEVGRDTLNNWMNGRRTPEGESTNLLAAKLGPEIYDVLGLPRPDPMLQAIIRSWGNIPEPRRRRMADEAERYGAQTGMKRERTKKAD